MDIKLLPAILMSLLSFVCLAVILRGLRMAMRKTNWDMVTQQKIFSRTLVVLIVWIALVTILALMGFFTELSTMPPKPVLVIFIPAIILLFLSFSKKGKELLIATPPHWLIAMQSFRILVEILLWRAFVLNLLPVQMTFEGNNFDALSGLLAIPFAIAVMKKWSPRVVLVYNVIGLALLTNILVIAVLSMPTPLRYFMNEPANTLVGEFPFVYLPAILVVIALAFHIFSLRQLWLLRKK
ncbi:MAG: hypothetical protein V4557_05300 [Bacteroidota bacterium]